MSFGDPNVIAIMLWVGGYKRHNRYSNYSTRIKHCSLMLQLGCYKFSAQNLWVEQLLYSVFYSSWLWMFTIQWRIGSIKWIQEKGTDGVLGIRTLNWSMRGTDESSGLWLHPHILHNKIHFSIKMNSEKSTDGVVGIQTLNWSMRGIYESRGLRPYAPVLHIKIHFSIKMNSPVKIEPVETFKFGKRWHWKLSQLIITQIQGF